MSSTDTSPASFVQTPDINISVADVFGIDSEMIVPAFSE